MSRVEIETLCRALEAAYRGDEHHALLENLRDERDHEWDARPAEYSVEVFGGDPQLSVADLMRHVGATKQWWTNHAFGDASLEWRLAGPPSDDRARIMGWLDAEHARFADAVAALSSDADLDAEHRTFSGQTITTREVVDSLIHHDLYHSGEVNRQRALLRGVSGVLEVFEGSSTPS